MPTVIDSLIVTLGLDTKGYKKGAQEARRENAAIKDDARKTGQELKKHGAEGAEFFSQMAKEAAKLLLLFKGASGIQGFFEGIIKSSAALGLTAKNLGTTADELKTFGNLAARFGGSVEEMAATLQNLRRAKFDLDTTGSQSILPWLNLMQISLVDKATGKMKDYAQILKELHDYAMNLTALRGRPDAYNVLTSAGVDTGTANLVLDPNFDQEVTAMRDMVHNQDEISESALRLLQRYTQLRQEMNQWGGDMLVLLEPALMKIMGWLERMGQWTTENMPKIIKDFKEWNAAISAAFDGNWDALAQKFAEVTKAMQSNWDSFVEHVQSTQWGNKATNWLSDFLSKIDHKDMSPEAVRRRNQMFHPFDTWAAARKQDDTTSAVHGAVRSGIDWLLGTGMDNLFPSPSGNNSSRLKEGRAQGKADDATLRRGVDWLFGPGLDALFPMPSSGGLPGHMQYPGALSAPGITYNSVETGDINVVAPPGADPRAFGNAIGNTLKAKQMAIQANSAQR